MTFPYKSVLVLGATSGIGLALAEKMIQNGCHVIGVGRRQERLDEFVQKHGKDKASLVKFDITDLAGIPSFMKEFVKSTPLT
jgi:NADP-dependent 3-hydroxy acid dehydrogenase YdfG